MPVLRRFKHGELWKFSITKLFSYESLDKTEDSLHAHKYKSTFDQMVNNLPQRDIYHGHVDIWFYPIRQGMDINLTLLHFLKDWKLSNPIKIKP